MYIKVTNNQPSAQEDNEYLISRDETYKTYSSEMTEKKEKVEDNKDGICQIKCTFLEEMKTFIAYIS